MTTNIKTNVRIYLPALLILAVLILILSNPQETLTASKQGLDAWLTIVLPALLPFFVLTDLMMGFGLVNFIGILLEPFMKKIFRLPGAGGFVVAMSLSSGFPIGAKITGKLRRDNLITKIEAERLICFANTVDPIYMIGAVAIGMFGLPELAITFLLAHYLSIIVIGLLMRLHKGAETQEPPPQSGYLKRALQSLADHRSHKNFGDLFHDAVKNSVNSMLVIGGCIIVFSVLVRVLTVSGLLSLITSAISPLLKLMGIQPEIFPSLISGIFEITIGTQSASLATATITQKAFAASFIMAWNGLSVHSQVASMLYDTDISMKPFVIARMIHAVLAGVLTIVLLNPASHVLKIQQLTLPVLAKASVFSQPTFLTRLWLSTKIAIIMLGILLLINLILKIYRRLIVFWVG